MKKSILRICLAAGLLTCASPTRVRAAEENLRDAENFGKLLCGQIDLSRPDMEEVKRQASLGKFAAALDAWRDYQVGALRKANLGGFNWHGDQVSSHRLLVAELLSGRLSEPEYSKASATNSFAFRDTFGLSGEPGTAIHTDWLAKDAQGHFSPDYMNLFFAIPLTVRYWQSGDPVYLRKWFQITADFACNQKRAVEALDAATRRQVPCSWSRDAQSSLSQGDRVLVMIRSLGVLAKSLPEGGRPAKWEDIYKPVMSPLPPASRDMVPAVELAQIALSLINDHPAALLERYQNAGAVPNQRRNGLTAILLTAVQFPEFTASRDLLQKGEAGLRDYLQGAFHLDGGMLEQSFNYNLGDAASLGELAAWLRPIQPELANLLEERQIGFYRVVASLATPLAGLPAMSSQGPGNPPPVWADPDVRQKWLAGQINKLPGTNDPLVSQIAGQFVDPAKTTAAACTSVAFPFSGYYVQRRDWRWDSPYLFLQACRPGRGHKNMGHNAIQMTAYGRPLLVSNGVPVYTPAQLPETMRPDFAAINVLLDERSSLKVNTVMVDGKSQNSDVPVAQIGHATPIETRWHTSPHFDFVEGFYALGYPKPNVDHQRQIIFVRNPGFWIIADILTNRDQQEHAFTQIWNFPPWRDGPKNPVYGFKNEEVILSQPASQLHTEDPKGPNVWLYHFGSSPLEYTKHYGEKNPYLGWYAIGFGNITPAPDVMVNWKSSQNSVLVTVIWPTPDGAPPGVKPLNLSPSGDPSCAALSLTLPDGSVLAYQSSHEPKLIERESLRIEARTLLTLKSPDGVTRGLVLDNAGTAPNNFDFTRQGKTMANRIPYIIPQ